MVGHASLVAQIIKNPPAMRETWVRSLGWEDPLKKGKATYSSILYTWTSPDGQHKIRLIIFFAAKDGEALYSQQKQDWELTVAQIMNSLLPNSDLN